MNTKPTALVGTAAIANLRQYQKEAVEAAITKLEPGVRTMVELPTGSGKGRIIARISQILTSEGKQVLIIAPRKRLLKQLQSALGSQVHGTLSASYGNDLGDKHLLIAGTFQTMTLRPEMKSPDVILVDECHLVPPVGPFCALLARYPKAAILGLTATPFRQSSRITGAGLNWKSVFSMTIPDLIKDKFLVPPVSVSTGSGSIQFGMRRSKLSIATGRIVPVLTEEVTRRGRLKCVVFCGSIAHAKQVASLLSSQGEELVHIVHSHQRQKTQDDQFREFESATTRAWLVNVGMVSIGVDIPSIDCIAILRDITTLAMLIQIIGRGLRIFEGKLDCLVFDFDGGTTRFGCIDAPQLGKTACRDHLQSLNGSLVSGTLKPREPKLHDHAVRAQLLSTENDGYLKTTYQGPRQSTDSNGNVSKDHELLYQGMVLIGIERIQLNSKSSKFKRGDQVLVKRLIDQNVQIIC